MIPRQLIRLGCLIVLATVGLPRPASASKHPAANLYFRIRDRVDGGPLLDVSPNDLQLDFARLKGELIELRGPVRGLLSLDARAWTLLVESGGESWTISYLAEAPETDGDGQKRFMPRVNDRVRILARIVPTMAGSVTGKLVLVAAVPEWQAAKVDAARAEAARKDETKALAAAKKRAAMKSLASRGVAGDLYRPVYQSATLSEAEIIRRYRDAILFFNKRLGSKKADAIARSILYFSRKNGLDPRLVMAVIAAESNFNAKAVSRTGARGLGQLMPGTARGLGVKNSFDANQNLDGATRLLRGHLGTFSRKTGYVTREAIELALACYNAGAGAVNKYKGIPPYRETRNYIAKVTRLYLQMAPELRPYLQKR